MSKRFASASVHPLSWPDGFPRTKRTESSRFKSTLHAALENVQEALRKFASDSGKKMEGVVISSNYSLTDTKPKDAGVAVYFTWDGERTCIPVDRYQLVQDNLQAIFHCIEAKRTMLRHGGINLVKAAFRGYAALPDPASMTWRDVLGYQGDSLEECRQVWKKLVRQHHPDRSGGNAEMAAAINAAWEVAQEVLS